MNFSVSRQKDKFSKDFYYCRIRSDYTVVKGLRCTKKVTLI